MKKILFSLLLLIFLLGFSTGAKAEVYPSQCQTGQTGGAQNGCVTTNDSQILSQQCTPVYGSATCSTMPGYLNAMQNDCLANSPATIDCATITNGGFYGREASAFASYQQQNSTGGNQAGSTNQNPTGGSSQAAGASGNLVFPDQSGLPDAPGGVKGVLTSFLNWLLLIIGIIAMIAFVISGLQYFMSAGDEKLAAAAKRNMTYSILGVIAALAGFVIVIAVDAALRGMSNF
jgi:hypothetical protein